MRIITDSTSDIDTQLATQYNIDVVPLKVIISGQEYKDRVDIQPNEFYTLLEQAEALPTTSQPSPQDFLNLYEDALKNDEDVIVLTLSSAVSGTYQSATIAKDLAESDRIHVIDSMNATQGLRLLVEKAIQLRDQNTPTQDVVNILEEYKHNIKIIALVDTLEYFYKGGRLSKTSAVAGTLLKLKPIVGLVDGKLELISKARGTQKATSKIIELINADGEINLDEPVCIGYTGSDDGLEKFEDTLKDAFGFSNPLYAFVGPVIGTHAGPGARLIAYIKK